ncbi:MAG: LytTR family DNA-binding domain-containing protein [Desulfobacterales bacterium]|nr:LytTR family DNA-binding domain-containing protein [Desulfobacterales bacterium]
MRKWTAIIADDEENLRIGIAGMLEKLWPELEIVGQAENGPDALSLFEKESPDMAFLDIRMPGMNGVAVAKRISPRCKVVFITAYDQYAVQAFESEAVDYILKPPTMERLQTTVSRLKKQLEAGTGPAGSRRDIDKVIQVLENRQDPDYLRLVKVKTGTELRFVPVSEVIYFKAEDKYTVVQNPDHEFLIKTPIKELEERLDPKTFWRVHRNAIVNVDRIKVIKRSFTNQMVIGFDSTDGTIPVSRSYEHLFRQM